MTPVCAPPRHAPTCFAASRRNRRTAPCGHCRPAAAWWATSATASTMPRRCTLPMRPVQILLNNFLYDLSELPIPTDRVADADLLAPRRWDTAFVRNFMLCFGPLSSLFDLLAFALLYRVLHTPAAIFQTAWFVQ